jgi:NADH:ubiquinone oxidoreductase subunit C
VLTRYLYYTEDVKKHLILGTGARTDGGDIVSPKKLETELLLLPGATEVEARPDGLWINAPALNVRAMAQKMVWLGAHFSTMTATALPNGETELIYHYLLNRQNVNFAVQTHSQVINSIVEITPAANWIEQEIQELYNVHFRGHPRPTRLIHLPAQFFGSFSKVNEVEF